MTQIARYSEHIYIKAYTTSEKISEMPLNDRNNAILKCLLPVLAFAGQKKEESNIDELVFIIGGDISLYFKQLTANELYLCCQKGIRGEYGENYGVTALTVHKWVKAYLSNDERNQLIKKYNQHQQQLQEAPTPLTDEEKDQLMQQGWEMLINNFNNGVFKVVDEIDPANALYNWALKKEIIKEPTVEEKKEYYNRAEMIIKSRIEAEKNKGYLRPTDYRSAILRLQERQTNEVMVLAKKLALKKYLENN